MAKKTNSLKNHILDGFELTYESPMQIGIKGEGRVYYSVYLTYTYQHVERASVTYEVSRRYKITQSGDNLNKAFSAKLGLKVEVLNASNSYVNSWCELANDNDLQGVQMLTFTHFGNMTEDEVKAVLYNNIEAAEDFITAMFPHQCGF